MHGRPERLAGEIDVADAEALRVDAALHGGAEVFVGHVRFLPLGGAAEDEGELVGAGVLEAELGVFAAGNLSGTKVTDAGLARLKTMSRLTKLNVSRTAVTEQGVAEAKKFLPFWVNVQR